MASQQVHSERLEEACQQSSLEGGTELRGANHRSEVLFSDEQHFVTQLRALSGQVAQAEVQCEELGCWLTYVT